MAGRPARWPAVLAMAALPISSCGVGPNAPVYDDLDPEQVAVRLFEISHEVDPSNDELQELFGTIEDLDERADLYDALGGLRAAENPTVIRVEALEDLGAVAVDLSAGLIGGGEALYSVRLEHDNDVTPWTIRWFRGPGVQWPTARGRRDSGLTSSPPPG